MARRTVSRFEPYAQGLTWNAHHLDNHIEEAMRLTRVVSDTLAAIKGNVGRIEEALRRLLKAPMFERKEGKVREDEALNARRHMRFPYSLIWRLNIPHHCRIPC